MAKDPAFLFYYQDFLVGTTFMTLEEKGAYITLLCHLADKGSLPEEQILKVVPLTIWHAIKSKFKKDDKGFFNERLNEEVSKRKGFCQSRRDNRMSNIRQTSVVTSEGRMENEIVIEDEDVNSKGVKGCGEKGKKGQTIEERIASVRAVFEDKDFMDKVRKACPSVDFDKERAKMESWITANPKQSNKTNWKRFMNNWLCAEQEKLDEKGEKSGRCIEHTQGDRTEKYRKITKVVEV